jgi:hypothetical protein
MWMGSLVINLTLPEMKSQSQTFQFSLRSLNWKSWTTVSRLIGMLIGTAAIILDGVKNVQI